MAGPFGGFTRGAGLRKCGTSAIALLPALSVSRYLALGLWTGLYEWLKKPSSERGSKLVPFSANSTEATPDGSRATPATVTAASTASTGVRVWSEGAVVSLARARMIDPGLPALSRASTSMKIGPSGREAKSGRNSKAVPPPFTAIFSPEGQTRYVTEAMPLPSEAEPFTAKDEEKTPP